MRSALDRLDEIEKTNPHGRPDGNALWSPRWVIMEMFRGLLRRNLPLGEADVLRLLRWPVSGSTPVIKWLPLTGIANAAEKWAETNQIGQDMQEALNALVGPLRRAAHDNDCRKIADRLDALLAGGPRIALEPGEAWSDAALADLDGMRGKARQKWDALLLYCQAGGRAKYSERWRTGVEPLLAAVGFDPFKEHLLRWFPWWTGRGRNPSNAGLPGSRTTINSSRSRTSSCSVAWPGAAACGRTPNWPAPWPAWPSAPTARFRGRGRGWSPWGTPA